jgi:transposase
MSKDVPPPGQSSRQLPVSVEPAPGIDVVPSDDPNAATVKVPVIRLPVDQLPATPQQAPATVSVGAAETSPPVPAVSATDGLPDDPSVLKQMIAELVRALRQSRRHEQEVQQRLDGLLRRLYGPKPEHIDPNQGLLSFGDDIALSAVPSPPPSPEAAEDEPARRKSKPHGRRKPARELRREQHRYELTAAERLCPECHQERQEIGADATSQYDYKPAEVFVVEHQRVKYACKHCQGHVAIAPKPPQPIDRGLPGPDRKSVV